MDLLNGITEELQARGGRDPASDSDASDPEPAPTDESETADRDDEHVCDFCGADFDANRGRCPDCGAEIIVRGAR